MTLRTHTGLRQAIDERIERRRLATRRPTLQLEMVDRGMPQVASRPVDYTLLESDVKDAVARMLMPEELRVGDGL
jgi:hypothetical protein